MQSAWLPSMWLILLDAAQQKEVSIVLHDSTHWDKESAVSSAKQALRSRRQAKAHDSALETRHTV